MEKEILSLIITAVLGTLGGVLLFRPKKIAENVIQDEIIGAGDRAKKEADQLKRSTLEKIEGLKKTNEESMKTFQEFLNKVEESVKSKEDLLLKKENKLQEVKGALEVEQRKKSEEEIRFKSLSGQKTQTLEKKVGKKSEELKLEMIQNLENELHEDNEYKLKKLEEYHKEYAEKEARNTVLSALQRLSTSTSNEKKGLQVKVMNDANKPNVVGLNGENILFLEEQMDGVDVVFNDFPGVVTVSHYNLITRHITKKTLEKLFDYRGRITKEVVTLKIEEAKKDTDRELMAIGREALKRMNIKRQMPDECLQVIGRLQFRTSYGQNIMRHSYEVGIFALMMAYELGLDIETAKISGFLHDLGKAIDQNPDIIGAHDYLTKELMEKFHCFHDQEIHAAWTHHDSEPPKTPEAFLVKGADAISAGRPGARAESLDKYVERLNALQDIALSYEGVDKVSAMSAGRELRVMVNPGTIHDKEMQPLADVIAGEIKENVAYPGYVRVNIIRTTKSADIARPKAPSV
ncbi:MAG: Rnase Y domain-containing protein [Candidatus Gracilibacteria bacterium]